MITVYTRDTTLTYHNDEMEVYDGMLVILDAEEIIAVHKEFVYAIKDVGTQEETKH